MLCLLMSQVYNPPSPRQHAKSWLQGHDVPPPSIDDVIDTYRNRSMAPRPTNVQSNLQGKITQRFPLRSPHTGQHDTDRCA